MARYRIMSFDGGGIRGALTATLLHRLSREIPGLLPSVDLFAGVSTGSFIALVLANGRTTEDLVDLYSESNGKRIFTPRGWHLIRPKYGHRNLKALLESALQGSPRLTDLGRRVLIMSFRVIGPDKGHWGPVFFDNYPGSPTAEAGAVDVALSSSSAPTYFPSHNNHIDGGVVTNNPCVAGLAKAMEYGHYDISMLSFGTGYTCDMITGDTRRWGIFQWMLNPFSRPVLPIISVLADGTPEADTIIARQLLGRRYHRIDPPLAHSIALDAYRRIPELVALGMEYDLNPTVDWIKTYWFGRQDPANVQRQQDNGLRRLVEYGA